VQSPPTKQLFSLDQPGQAWSIPGDFTRGPVTRSGSRAKRTAPVRRVSRSALLSCARGGSENGRARHVARQTDQVGSPSGNRGRAIWRRGGPRKPVSKVADEQARRRRSEPPGPSPVPMERIVRAGGKPRTCGPRRRPTDAQNTLGVERPGRNCVRPRGRRGIDASMRRTAVYEEEPNSCWPRL